MVQRGTPYTVDFETLPIASRPDYPPRPVGVAIKRGAGRAHYFAFGHPTCNNCDEATARRALKEVWDSGEHVIFHHSKFDMAVAEEKLGLPPLAWDRVEDTLFSSYLCDPQARDLGLKELAEDWLGWPPEERDEVRAWLDGHRQLIQTEMGITLPNRTAKNTKLSAFTYLAPGDIVGRYACGDVDRTFALWRHTMPIVMNNGMLVAYNLERQVQPIFMQNEREGIRVALDQLEEDIEGYQAAFADAENWLRARLNNATLNLDADRDVAQTLIDNGIVAERDFSRTKTGLLSVSKDTLTPSMFGDRDVANMLGYRNRLKTCLSMFMVPWRDQASAMGGRITTQWNQVRNPGNHGGTRTGRPSTDGNNFLNISKSFEGTGDGWEHPTDELPRLPLCRRYLLPDEGHIWLKRDFDGQELRIFGHFESGALWRAYQENPKLDVHAFVGGMIKALTGQELPRKKVKVMDFLAIYGGGGPAAAAKLHCSLAEAREYLNMHAKALPGRTVVAEEITRIFRRNMPIRTLGGRLYFCEPAGYSKKHKKFMNMEYKGTNTLVQGSAADATKRAMARWCAMGGPTLSRFLVQVYDEMNISAPYDQRREAMEILREAMEGVPLSVKLLSSPEYGDTWGTLKKGEPV